MTQLNVDVKEFKAELNAGTKTPRIKLHHVYAISLVFTYATIRVSQGIRS